MVCPVAGTRQAFLYPWHGFARTEEGDAGEAVGCAIRALADVIEPPYRAAAVRQVEDTWAVGACAVEVAELPADIDGEELLLTVTEDRERELRVDGRPSLVGIEGLVRVAARRDDAFVLRARRVAGAFWELTVDPL